MRIRVWSIGLLFTLLGALAQADDRGGMYMGAGSCLYYFELGGTGFDESAATVRVFGGYKMNEHVSFEMGYTSLFESSASVLGTDIDFDGSSWDVSVRPTLPVSDKFEIFGVLGFARYDIDMTISTPLGNVSVSDSGTELHYGLGGMLNLNDKWSLRGEWIFVDVDDGDLSMLSFSASYNFH